VISGTVGATATTETFAVVATDADNLASNPTSLTISISKGPVVFGAAGSFAVLAGSAITNTGATSIIGDVGTYPTLAENGFASVSLAGTNHGADGVTQAAKTALASAYGDASSRSPATLEAAQLGGSTLTAGVYASGTFALTGTLTLDAQNNPYAEFVFQAGSTLITAANSNIVLLNGANPCNVVWTVGSSATFGATTQFVGDVLAQTSITAGAAGNFEGRLMAEAGAVTMDTDTITNADCASPNAPSVTTVSLAAASDGQPGYTQTLTSTGGSGAISWTIPAGVLPAGLSLNSTTGVISGTVGATATTETFAVVATDADNLASNPTSLTITVNTG